VAILDPMTPYFVPSVGGPVGFEPEIAQRLAAGLGLGFVRWAETTSARVPAGADLTMHIFEFEPGDSFPKTDVPYYPKYPEVAVRKSSHPGAISTMHGLRGLRLGVTGSFATQYVEQVMRPIHRAKVFADQGVALAALRRGKIDGLVAMQGEVGGIVSQSDDLEAVGLLPPHHFFVLRFPRGSKLQPMVTRLLVALRASGTLKRMEVRTLGVLPPVSQLRP
jgi:ABC-type amino acid transport substrate-binding protein